MRRKTLPHSDHLHIWHDQSWLSIIWKVQAIFPSLLQKACEIFVVKLNQTLRQCSLHQATQEVQVDPTDNQAKWWGEGESV